MSRNRQRYLLICIVAVIFIISFNFKFTSTVINDAASVSRMEHTQSFSVSGNADVSQMHTNHHVISSSGINTTRRSQIDVSSEQFKNVVFIIVDDLRPQLSPYYGQDYPYPEITQEINTPNIERLARQSIVFHRAYAQFHWCGPSRASLMTGRRPDTTRYVINGKWSKFMKNFTTLPQYFREAGYTTISAGKIFHGTDSKRDEAAWSEAPQRWSRFLGGFPEETFGSNNSPPYEGLSVSQEQRAEYPIVDDFTLDYALDRLAHHAAAARSGEQPLFLGLGLTRPHVPLICPQSNHDLYSLEPQHFFQDQVSGKPFQSELKQGVNYTIQKRHSYFACVSYMDEQVGRILDGLKQHDLWDNTIVSLVADHGYHLGENGILGKTSTHEMALHVPLIIRVPGITDGGITTRTPVESLDIFPTLVEAAGLGSVEPCAVNTSVDVTLCIEGTSLLPLTRDPSLVLKPGALSQAKVQEGNVYSLRTDQFRYTAGAALVHTRQDNGLYTATLDWNITWLQPKLYDHAIDHGELVNVHDDPIYTEVVPQLQAQMQEMVGSRRDAPDDGRPIERKDKSILSLSA